MAKFIYKAKNGPEEVLEGNIEADSENAAVKKLIRSGYYPLLVRAEKMNGGGVKGRRVGLRDLANFTRCLSGLIDSGVTLYNALGVIENQTRSRSLRHIISDVKSSIKKGNNFSEALKNNPEIFSGLYINLARSGEESGSLNEALASMADFLDKQEDLRSRVIAALAYPCLMAAVGLATIFILVTFIVPRLVNMFIAAGETLPLATSMLVASCSFMKAYWVIIIIFIAAVLSLLKFNKLSHIPEDAVDRIKLKAPIFGKLISCSELARFSRTLSMLLKNGVSILYALKIVSRVVTNSVVRQDICAIHAGVESGLSFSAAIKKVKRFPLFISDMAAIGEEGGFLDKALLNIARNYETETDRAIKIITALLEPVIILIMGLAVGFIVIAMLLPVFQISLTVN